MVARILITGNNGLHIECDVVIAAIGLDPQTVHAEPSFGTNRGIGRRSIFADVRTGHLCDRGLRGSGRQRASVS